MYYQSITIYLIPIVSYLKTTIRTKSAKRETPKPSLASFRPNSSQASLSGSRAQALTYREVKMIVMQRLIKVAPHLRFDRDPLGHPGFHPAVQFLRAHFFGFRGSSRPLKVSFDVRCSGTKSLKVRDSERGIPVGNGMGFLLASR